MKRLVVVLSLGAVAGGVLLSGCSKSKNATTQSGNSAGSTTANGASDQPVEMKIKWAPGKEYPMRMELEQTTKTDVPGQPQPLIQEVKITQDFDFSGLKQLDNGGWELELKFESEMMNVSQGDHNVASFDSAQSPAQDAGNPVAPILRAMIGARIQYFTDANGKVEKVGGLDELRNRIDTTGKPQEQAMFNQMFSEDTLKQYGSFADAMPDHAVTIGDSWRLKKDVSTPIGVLTLNLEYTFKNWEQHASRNCAHVEAEGDISTKSVSTASGMMVEIKKGKISGEFWYDPALGMIVEGNNNQDLSLKVTTRTQTMTSQFNQKVRVALVEGQ
jgi:hypothetical protein